MTFADDGGWPAVLGALSAGTDLARVDAEAAMREILAGGATPAQIAGFLVALRMKGETVDELTGFLDAMREAATTVPLRGDSVVIDTCGTGGDGSHSINVSTVAALVVAGAGVAVCKHGNRAASSRCGSADLLEAFGVNIEADAELVARCITEVGIGFCLAPLYHPAARHAGPTRRELGIPTVFNYLGPLANPGGVLHQVVGVSDPAMAERMIEVLRAHGSKRAMVVYGHDGLDELSVTAPSTVLELRDGEITTFEVDPVEFGVGGHNPRDLRGGDAQENKAFAEAILAGEPGAQRDIVVLNAAAALVVADAASDLPEGIEQARAAIDSGLAASTLERFVVVSQG